MNPSNCTVIVLRDGHELLRLPIDHAAQAVAPAGIDVPTVARALRDALSSIDAPPGARSALGAHLRYFR
jgi:hypothetical protein